MRSVMRSATQSAPLPRAVWIAWILLLLAPGLAGAHPVAQGAMTIQILSDRIRLEARASMEEVFVQNANSETKDAGLAVDELCRRHGDYLLQHVHVFADDQSLAGRIRRVTPPQGPGSQRALYSFEYELATKPARIRISEDVLNEFDYAAGNRWEASYVVRIERPGQAPDEGLLLTSRQPLTIECNWAASSLKAASTTATLDKWRLTRQYIRHGIMHILTGYDHLLFISALVLAVVTLWDLIKVITAFTLAHSITLTLSVLHLVRLPSRVVEPMIAVSIVFVAVQNVFWPERTRGATRLTVAFFFGLFHGLGFAGGLLEAMEGMAGLTVGLAILAFSLGVELGHQVVVVPIFSVLKLLRSRRGEASRLAEYLFRYGSSAISVAGMFYLVAALR
jgi:hydrogenase/urease accessory protein HupE